MVNSARHLKQSTSLKERIKRLTFRRSFWVGLGLIVLLGLVIGVGIWSMQQTRQAHQKEVAQWLQGYDQFYKTATQQLAEEQAQPEPALKSLRNFNTALQNWQPPAQPTFGPLLLLSTEFKAAQAAVDKDRQDISKKIQEIVSLLDYQTQAIKPLQELSNRKTTNLEELKSFTNEWSTKVETLKTVQPPEKAKAFHQSLVTAMNDITLQLQALVPLFEKQDVAGFNTKQQELVTKIAILQALQDQWQAISTKTDSELTHNLSRFQQHLAPLRNYATK